MIVSEKVFNMNNTTDTSLPIDFIFFIKPWQKYLFFGIYCIDGLENLTAFVGNLLIIVAVLKFKKLQTNAHYFILNLAVADCFASCTTPIEAVHFGWLIKTGSKEKSVSFCLAHGWWLYFGNCQNLVSMLLITVDRWISIEFPFFHKIKMNETIVWRLIAVSWVFSVITASAIVFPKGTCFTHSPPSLAMISTIMLCLTITIISYGRIITIALTSVKSKRTETKFKMAKTTGMFDLVLYSLTWLCDTGV